MKKPPPDQVFVGCFIACKSTGPARVWPRTVKQEKGRKSWPGCKAKTCRGPRSFAHLIKANWNSSRSAVPPLAAPSFSRQTARASNVRIGEAFADLAAKQLLVVGHVASPRDEPLHGVEQFQPVFQRRFGNGLPVVKTPGAMEKTPLALHALNIDLQLFAVLGDAFPTDFCFCGHGN